MISRSTTFLVVFFGILMVSSFSCDLINPEEPIPSFICIDTIAMNSAGHGNDVHDIVDAWVFDNEQLVGVYELPAVVPILKNGESNIRIRPGVKLNGQASSRWPYEFLEDFVQTVELFEDSTICISPTLPYKENAQTPWIEDFETSTQQSLTATSVSQNSVEIVSGAEAFDTKSAKLSLLSGQSIFECQSNQAFSLPDAGAAVILEFSYRCTRPFVVSVLSSNPGGSVQTPVIQINESEEWNHIYISLTDIASGFFSAQHKPVFGFLRNDGSEEEITVYLDNIKLSHF